jgi:hypothetical protein
LADERVDIADLDAEQIVAFEGGEKVILVIHAMDMTADMKRQYRKLKGRK